MALNATDINTSLDSGVVFGGHQCFAPLETFNFSVNIISLLVNIFHLSVISSLESLKRTRYHCVLINISLADITNVISVAIFYSCYSFIYFNYRVGEPILKVPLTFELTFGNYISYSVFVVASVQKYLAICRPHNYQSSFLIRRMPAVFVMAWLYVLCVTLSYSVITSLNSSPWVKTAEFTMIQLSLLAAVPNLISIILLTKVYRAMRRPSNQPHDKKADRQERRGATYLMIIFTLEMIVFLLNLTCVVSLKFTGTFVVCKIWHGFIKAPYTLSNTIIYGWRSKSYRRKVCKLFGFKIAGLGSVEVSSH